MKIGRTGPVDYVYHVSRSRGNTDAGESEYNHIVLSESSDVHIYIYIHIYTHIYIYIYVCIHIYIYIHVYMYIYIYMYT